MSSNNIDKISQAELKNKSDLLVGSLKQSHFEAEGRRGTAPHFGDGEQSRQQNKLDFLRPDFTNPVGSVQRQGMEVISGGQQTPPEMAALNVKADFQKRSTTSYGIQEIGPMMQGK